MMTKQRTTKTYTSPHNTHKQVMSTQQTMLKKLVDHIAYLQEKEKKRSYQ
jgi:hypothetical protein